MTLIFWLLVIYLSFKLTEKLIIYCLADISNALLLDIARPYTFYLSISQVNVATKAALWGSRQSSLWIPEARLYSNPFLLLSTAANLLSLPHHESLLIPLANRRLWTALEWTPSRPTRATPITPAAPGDQTDMGMCPVCLPFPSDCLHCICLSLPWHGFVLDHTMHLSQHLLL